VEIKDIDLPQEMKRAMAKQAEAERERRAKVIAAEGEYQASTKLALAAEIIQQFPVAMQLRFLQTVVEVAAENNSTTLFPIPIELFRPLLQPGEPASKEATARALKYAAESMVEALPEGGDRAAIKAAAKRMIGMTPEAPDKERVPVARDDSDAEAKD
jgi:regulator of protease activity HflC (stomatin/prohibitin superfamily)